MVVIETTKILWAMSIRMKHFVALYLSIVKLRYQILAYVGAYSLLNIDPPSMEFPKKDGHWDPSPSSQTSLSQLQGEVVFLS